MAVGRAKALGLNAMRCSAVVSGQSEVNRSRTALLGGRIEANPADYNSEEAVSR